MTKHTGWTAHPDDSHTAKIGRYEVLIHPPRPTNFYRGDHKGEPTHVGLPRRTVSWRGSHSGGAFTLDGAKALALWVVQNDMTGRSPPESLWPVEELAARAEWNQTVDYVNATYGEN